MKSKRDEADFEWKKLQITQLEELAEVGYIDIFYFDESAFSLTPCVPYAWQPKGKNIEIPTCRSKSISVAGFYTKDNKFIDYQSDKTMNAQRLVDIFNDFVSKTTKKTVVVLDNSPVHTSHLFTSFTPKWEEENDVYLFFLPKYSPELNCIEMLWKAIKYTWLEWNAYLSIDNLRENLNFVLKNIGKKFNIQFV